MLGLLKTIYWNSKILAKSATNSTSIIPSSRRKNNEMPYILSQHLQLSGSSTSFSHKSDKNTFSFSSLQEVSLEVVNLRLCLCGPALKRLSFSWGIRHHTFVYILLHSKPARMPYDSLRLINCVLALCASIGDWRQVFLAVFESRVKRQIKKEQFLRKNVFYTD